MVGLQPNEICWELSSQAYRELSELELSDADYEGQKQSLRALLVEYFRAEACLGKLGKTIAPLGGSPAGGKVLKVRWALPGGGKSGGLRLAIIAYCQEKRVVIAAIFPRREDPKDDDFASAVLSYEADRS